MGLPNRYNGGGPLQGVVLVDAVTGEAYTADGGAGGPTVVAGGDGSTAATALNPLPVFEAQGLIASGSLALTANTAATIIGVFAGRRGIRVLNWTASPVYIGEGTTGTPASGAGSDVIPAFANGLPGQWEPPYAPVNGLRAVGASAGGLTVTAW